MFSGVDNEGGDGMLVEMMLLLLLFEVSFKMKLRLKFPKLRLLPPGIEVRLGLVFADVVAELVALFVMFISPMMLVKLAGSFILAVG